MRTRRAGKISELKGNRKNELSFSRAKGQPDHHISIIKGGCNEERLGQ